MKLLKNKGISLLEVVIGTSILLSVMLAMMGAYSVFLRVTLQNTAKLQATLLLEEGVEVVRLLRDQSWNNTFGDWNTGTTYGVLKGESSWSVVPGSLYVNEDFERSFEVFNVMRDGNDEVSVTGTLDANTKMVVFSVSWATRLGTTTKQMTSYFTNIF